MKLIPKLMLWFFFSIAISPEAHSFLVSTAYQETAPKFILDEQGNPSGVCVDIFNAIENESSILEFSKPKDYVPIKRIFHNMEKGTVLIYCGAGFNKKRAEKFNYSNIPLYTIKTVLVGSRDIGRDLTSIDDLRKYDDLTFSAIQGTSTYRLLKKLALPLSPQFVWKVDQGMALVARKKGSIFAYHSLGILYVMKNNKWSGLKVLDVTLREYQHSMLYSKYLPDKYKAEIERTLKILKDNKTIDQIMLMYQ